MAEPLPRRRFARLCRGSDRATLAALIADCYRARGWETAVHPLAGRVELRREGACRTLVVRRAGLWAPASDSNPDVDALFFVGRGRAPPDALGPAALYELLFYGLDRETCERLFRERFGRSPYRRPPSGPERVTRALQRGLAADPERAIRGAAALAVVLAVALLAVGLPGAPTEESAAPGATPAAIAPSAEGANGDAEAEVAAGGAATTGADAAPWPTNQNWPTAGAGMARTRSNPAAAGPLGNVTIRRTLTPQAGIAGAPVLANGTAYVSGYGGVLIATEARSLSPRWDVETDGLASVTPTVTADAIYATSGSTVYATVSESASDREDPENQTWSVADLGATVAGAPAVAGGRVYVATTRGRVVAMDARTGAVRWNVSVGNHSLAAPAAAAGSVFVAHGGGVTALARDGTVRWRWNGSEVVAAPAVARGTVLVGTENGTVAALEARTGAPRWIAAANGSVKSGVAVVSDLGLAIVGDETGELYAIETRNGSVRWTRSLDGAVAAAPAAAGRTFYVTTRNGSVYGVTTLAGTVRWRTTLGAPVVLPPVVADGALYVADVSGELHVLRGTRHTGKRRGEYCDALGGRYDDVHCGTE